MVRHKIMQKKLILKNGNYSWVLLMFYNCLHSKQLAKLYIKHYIVIGLYSLFLGVYTIAVIYCCVGCGISLEVGKQIETILYFLFVFQNKFFSFFGNINNLFYNVLNLLFPYLNTTTRSTIL